MPGFTGSGPSGTGVEFHRQHRWKIEDLGLPPAAAGGGQGSSGNGTQGGGNKAGGTPKSAQAALALYAQSIQLPSLEFDIETIKSASLEYKVVKIAKWKNCTVKFYDAWGLYKEFEKWQKAIWSQERGLQAATAYKGEPVFVLYDGSGAMKQRYKLKGAFPQSIDHGELSYTSSEIKLLSVVFTYDFAEIELFDDPIKATPGGIQRNNGEAAANTDINDPNSNAPEDGRS